MLAAGGRPASVRLPQGDEVCWVNALWFPDDSANCPRIGRSRPARVTPTAELYRSLNCGVETQQGEATGAVGMPNPAS